jgi:hypothetical protein
VRRTIVELQAKSSETSHHSLQIGMLARKTSVTTKSTRAMAKTAMHIGLDPRRGPRSGSIK